MQLKETDRIAVLGYGVTGRSVARYLRGRRIETLVLDTRPQPQDAVLLDGVRYLWSVRDWPDLQCDYVVVSPGLPLDACPVRQAQARGLAVISDIDLFFAEAAAPVYGITGTNGKSTVTTLVSHLLNAAGRRCAAGGNLGEPALDVLEDRAGCYALELSSFQLERSELQHFKAACILNVTEDHLDHHRSLAAYVESKQRIFANADLCVFNRDDPATVPAAPARAVSFGCGAPRGDDEWGVVGEGDDRWIAHGAEPIVPCGELPLPGAHNELNVMAALAMVADEVPSTRARQALVSFTGLSHRFQVVSTAGGITCIDDSKATNLGSALAALASFPAERRVVLIAGGDAKGVDLTPLADGLRGRVKHVVTIGVDGARVARVAAAAGIDATPAGDMEEAVARAAEHLHPGDTLLLSPACASLDMYASYAERGDAFTAAVQAAFARGSR